MPVGPKETQLWISVCIPHASAARFAAGDEEILKKVDCLVGVIKNTAMEDVEIVARLQHGISSRFATPGRFCKHEVLAWLFDKWVAEKAYLLSEVAKSAVAPK